MKRYFLTFANSDYDSEVLGRITKEAEDLGLFDEIRALDESCFDASFASYWNGKLKGVRGYGYWVWKPYILMKTLKEMNDGDTLLYADAGCRLNVKGKKRMLAYYKLLDKSPTGVIAFRQPEHHPFRNKKGKRRFMRNWYIERKWVKGDMIDYFGIRERKDILDTPQLLGGIFFLKKCAESVSLIKSIEDLYYSHYYLATDEPSVAPNFPDFEENRHDQAIFSVTFKKANADILSSKELEDEASIVNNHPILALRCIANRGNDEPVEVMRKRLWKSYPCSFIKYLLRERNPRLLNR